MSYKLLFFDTETTGNRENDRLCQIAYICEEAIGNEMFKPPLPISIDAMAVHHITNKMVDGKPVFIDSPSHAYLRERAQDPETVFVAHNAPFDLGMLKKEGIEPMNTICTLKVVRALDDENKIPSYKLQYLRYLLDIDIEATAHDAMGDVLVLQKVYAYLEKLLREKRNLDTDEAIRIMIDISSLPSLLKHITFGKHKGKTIADVAKEDRGYLEWLYKEKQKDAANETEWIYTLEFYLK